MNGSCKACGQPCKVGLLDLGIGRYEYWGSKEVDTRIEAVSNCCENTAVNDTNHEITVQMVKNQRELDRSGY